MPGRFIVMVTKRISSIHSSQLKEAQQELISLASARHGVQKIQNFVGFNDNIYHIVSISEWQQKQDWHKWYNCKERISVINKINKLDVDITYLWKRKNDYPLL